MNWLKWRCAWPHFMKNIKQNFETTINFDGIIHHKDLKLFYRIVTICITNPIENIFHDI